MVIDSTEADILGFKTAYGFAWKRHKKIQQRYRKPLLLFQVIVLLRVPVQVFFAVSLVLDSKYAESKCALVRTNPLLLSQHLTYNVFGPYDIFLLLQFAAHVIPMTLKSWVGHMIVSR